MEEVGLGMNNVDNESDVLEECSVEPEPGAAMIVELTPSIYRASFVLRWQVPAYTHTHTHTHTHIQAPLPHTHTHTHTHIQALVPHTHTHTHTHIQALVPHTHT